MVGAFLYGLGQYDFEILQGKRDVGQYTKPTSFGDYQSIRHLKSPD